MRAWLIYGSDKKGWHALTYKWLLTKVESVYDTDQKPVEILYKTHFEVGDYKSKKYVKGIYPYKILYGKNEIEFIREQRLDQLRKE